MQIQTVLNSDIVMQFSTSAPYEASVDQGPPRPPALKPASPWNGAAGRCAAKAEFERLGNPNALFGIVQGGMFEHLRQEFWRPGRRWTFRHLRHRRA